MSNVRYFQLIVDKRNATYEDGYRMAYILLRLRQNDKEASRQKLTFSGYRQALIQDHIIDNMWNEGANDLLTHDVAAYLIASAIDLKGGVLWSLTKTPRYAHREMIDRKLMSKVNPRQYISGPQLLSVFSDSKKFMESSPR